MENMRTESQLDAYSVSGSSPPEAMMTERARYSVAYSRLEHETRVGLTLTLTLPDGTTETRGWPGGSEAATYHGVDMYASTLTDWLLDILPEAMHDIAQQKLGAYPPLTPEEEARRRLKFEQLCQALRQEPGVEAE